MNDPSGELQIAIVAALKAAPAVAGLVGVGIYDAVPDEAARKTYAGKAWPYVSLGQPQVLPDKADCIDGADVAYTVHGWCEGPKSVEVKNLGGAIAAALDGVEFALPSHRTVNCKIEEIRYLDDPDPLTKHVAVTFRVLTDPTV